MNIDKKIPIPNDHEKYHKGTQALLEKMEVGDSIFLGTRNEIASIRAQASCYGAKVGRKFTSRKMDGGWRIWRVE
jgi:hypothetical protein